MSQKGWFYSKSGRLGRKSLPMWLRALSAAVPWVTMLVLFLMIVKIDGAFFLDQGTLIDLPEGTSDVSRCDAYAFVSHTKEGCFIFFDDTRYDLSSSDQMAAFSQELFKQLSYAPTAKPTLLLLVDKRISVEDQMRVLQEAKSSGAVSVMIAENNEDTPE